MQFCSESLGILNAVKCNLTKLTTKKSWHSLGGHRLLVGSACAEHCFGWRLSVAVRSVFVEYSCWIVSVFCVQVARFFCLRQ